MAGTAQNPKGLFATKAGQRRRNSIRVRKAGDGKAPGFVQADMVVHCGPLGPGNSPGLWRPRMCSGWTENVATIGSLEVSPSSGTRRQNPTGAGSDTGGSSCKRRPSCWPLARPRVRSQPIT